MHDGVDLPDTLRAERPTRSWWRLVIGLPLLLIALGLAMDVSLGLPISRGATSLPKLLGGVLGFGALWLLGEGAGEWVWWKDRPTDPLTKRVFRLMTALVLWGVLLVVMWFVKAVVTSRA